MRKLTAKHVCAVAIIAVLYFFIPTATPVHLTAKVGPRTVALSWAPAPTAIAYDVYRGIGPDEEKRIARYVLTTRYTDSCLTNATSYCYRVAAENFAGASPMSNEIMAASQPLSFVYIQNGQTASGDIGIYVSENRATPSTVCDSDDVLLTLDGQVLANGLAYNSNTFKGTLTPLQTSMYSNGFHTLTASNIAGSVSLTVKFQNHDSINLHCDPFAFYDKPAWISATLRSAQPWTIDIWDITRHVVRQFAGRGATVHVSWSGTNDFGKSLPIGPYDVVLTTGLPESRYVVRTYLQRDVPIHAPAGHPS
ncbi:MAG: hypothetical protein ACLQVD_00760 [Capsulimonadaceae bacterium]